MKKLITFGALRNEDVIRTLPQEFFKLGSFN